ncbi:LysR family transcriptional regulator [Nocardia thailandica]
MARMDLLRHLRFFVAVAEEGHFGRAASALHMTQPPLSQGLRRLEQDLGVDLVHRTRQGAVLTAAGARLLPRARLLVDDADRFHAEARRIAGARGAVRWGATTALPDTLVAGCAAALAASEPGTRVTTRSGGTAELIADVRAGLCDLAVVEHPALLEGVTAGPVIALPRRLVVPAGHRIASAEQPAFRMLAGLTLATAPRTANPPGHDTLIDLLRARGLEVDTVAAPDERAVLAAVAAGTSFGWSASPPTPVPGVAWVSIAPRETALRVRIVAGPGAETEAAVLDRVLLRERLR